MFQTPGRRQAALKVVDPSTSHPPRFQPRHSSRAGVPGSYLFVATGAGKQFWCLLGRFCCASWKSNSNPKKKKQKDTVPDWLGEMFLQGGRCSRIRGEERSFLPMEEPQATAEDMGAATKAFLEN